MTKITQLSPLLVLLSAISVSAPALADEPAPSENQTVSDLSNTQDPTTAPNAIEQRAEQENAVLNNPFAISLYQPTYILPFYYVGSPYNAVYDGTTPDNQTLNNTELAFQFSFKVPVWSIDKMSRLYFAYTQQSYWQAYQDSPFFQETNYQPELFVTNQINRYLADGWLLSFVNLGAMHQSNGKGGDLERSWNRVYAEAILANGGWSVLVQPWYIIKDSSLDNHNSDIAHYMGHGVAWVSYKVGQQVFSVMVRNELESGFSRGAEEITWSFPLTTHLKGYMLLFSGYGQSLIEYNHYTNSVGLGISISDWI